MRNRFPLVFGIWTALAGLAWCQAEEVLLREDFKGNLVAGWSWVRENPSAWRTTDGGLEIRALPGNMWGPPNNASNILVRPLPPAVDCEMEVSVTLENHPTEQYEQVDLVWYYDDSHMVKLGQELVDEKLSIVMGREEKDRTRTIAIIPLESFKVRVRFRVKGNTIRGEFQLPGQDQWKTAGECDLPAKGEPKASLQVYQGPKTFERWARFAEFRIVRLAP